MKKNSFQKLKENDLDRLLNQSFLENLGQAGNERLLESISNRVLIKQSPGILWSTELFFNKFFFAISIVSFCASLFTLLNKPNLDNKQLLPKIEVSETITQVVKAKTTDTLTAKEQNRAEAVTITVKTEASTKPNRSEVKPVITETPEKAHLASLSTQNTLVSNPVLTDPITDKEPAKEVMPPPAKEYETIDRYFFPNLTQQQRKDNESEKKWMAKFVSRLKQDKGIEKYARIPASTDRSVKEFYMASGEVTNLSYRTFLFDLLLNDRREEFLIAKPNQSLWTNAAGINLFDSLSAVYFSDRQYDDYPVVNISVAGAELYCEWLTALANEIRSKENKPALLIRLPYEKEWLYAATVGHNDAVYPWFTDSVQNNKNRFLANFCIKKQADHFKQPITYPNGFNPNAYTAAGMAGNNNKIATFLAWSYEPNDFQLYNMCGNVSEMVYTDTKKLKAKGGNWNSNFEQLKLNSDDEFTGGVKPSPMVGFRVCVVEIK